MTTQGLNSEHAGHESKHYNSDMAVAQMVGDMQVDQGGKLQFMEVMVQNAADSEWEFTSYGVFEQDRTKDAVPQQFGPGTQDQGRLWRARGSKAVRHDLSLLAEPGHNVFYLGGHKYGFAICAHRELSAYGQGPERITELVRGGVVVGDVLGMKREGEKEE